MTRPGDDLTYDQLVDELTTEADALQRLIAPSFCVSGVDVARRLAALPEDARLRVARSAYRQLAACKVPLLLIPAHEAGPRKAVSTQPAPTTSAPTERAPEGSTR